MIDKYIVLYPPKQNVIYNEPMIIIVPYYNYNITHCLQSIINQTIFNIKDLPIYLFLIDDASSDEMLNRKNNLFLLNEKKITEIFGNVYLDYNTTNFSVQIAKKGEFHLIHLRKKENFGTLHSIYTSIQFLCNEFNLSEHSLIIIVDGDDQLFDNDTLMNVSKVYASDFITCTFGHYIKIKHNKDKTEIDDFNSQSRERVLQSNIKELIEKRKLRDNGIFIFSHLKTFCLSLFLKIPIEHLQKKNTDEFYRSATDVAIMLPLVELSGTSLRYLAFLTYKYCINNELSHFQNEEKLKIQSDNCIEIFSKQKLDPLFT